MKSLYAIFFKRKINSHEYLVYVTKNRFPNLKGCSLESVKIYCTITVSRRERLSDEPVVIAVQGAISEIMLCSKSLY